MHKINTIYNVNNLSSTYMNYQYAVIRDCGSDGYWYWGAYNDVTIAMQAAKEIGNGILVETKNIVKA